MKRYIILLAAIFIGYSSFGQVSQMESKIAGIIENRELELGFAVCDLSAGDTLSINGSSRFPMQSVFKFPLALAVLNEVDKRVLGLHQPIYFGQEDLRAGLWSPIEKLYPDAGVRLPLSELVAYTVAQSDNVGCDLLLKMLGGASVVNNYIHSNGVADISIKNNEQEIQSSWAIQFDNWTTPQAMIQLLRLFDNKELLLPDTHTFLWSVMAQTSTGSIRDKLPSDAVVVHKTGTSGYNSDRVSAATNDVGIMVLPSGKHIAFAIFITNSKERPEVNAEVIADIAQLLYAL